MKRFAFSLALSLALVYGGAQVFARGGGHGGGGGHASGHAGGHAGGEHHSAEHHEGEHHAAENHGAENHGAENHGAENHNGEHHSAENHNVNHNVNHNYNSHNAYHNSHWADHNRPFSHNWYGNHAGAWGGWGYGNPWGVASFAAASDWLGLGAGVGPLWGGYGPGATNVYANDNGGYYNADSDNTGNYANYASTSDGPVTINNPYDPEVTAPTLSAAQLAAETAAAQQLASQGVAQPNAADEFLPLGVFTLAPVGQTEATAMLQLAVSKQGVLRGTYIDLLSDSDQPIRGSVNKKTQLAAFTFGAKGKVTLQTALANLTDPSGPISVHYENGQTRNWTIARFAKEPSETDPKANDNSGTPEGTNKLSQK